MEKVTGYIAAGGIGNRLNPHTIEIPKPMLPMGDGKRRIIDFSLETCNKYCENIFITTCHKAEKVEQHVDNSSKIIFLRDIRVVGNGGSILEHSKKVAKDISKDLLVIPGDHVLSNFPISEFADHHRKTKADITLMITQPKSFGEYIVLNKGKAEKIVFSKKENCWSTIGIYLISSNYLSKWMKYHLRTGWNGEELCVTKDIIHPAINNANVETFILPDSAYWNDAGVIPRYYFNNMLLSQKQNVIDENSNINPDADLKECIIIGETIIEKPIVLRNAIISSNNKKELQITQL